MLGFNLGMGKPSKVPETASIAYTGELLPTGTASYGGISIDATKRYLKNSGKDKTPALVESGQGKFFNGTNQYINTGIIPNQAEGTLITRFTYATGMLSKRVIGSYDSGRFYIGINATGKIGAGLGEAFDTTIIHNPTLVNGRSYHVAFKHAGNSYSLFVDGVLSISGTATGTIPALPMYVGAMNSNSVASGYFNNVIDETYYYDVALPDTAIQSLYLYPEKVKAYNGAIVPDIGYEANCKLFLPLCENSGSNVVNVAVARGSDISLNTFNMDGTELTKTSSTFPSTISGSIPLGAVWLTINVNITAPVSKLYTIELDVIVNSGNTTFDRYYNGSAVISTYAKTLTTGKNYITVSGRNGTSLYLYFQQNTTTNITINSATIKEITAFPLTNYTTTQHTSAAQLSYGAQCTAWKRDSLGVLLGMSNGLSFDGGVSVKQVNTNGIPTIAGFAIEGIVYVDGVEALHGCINDGAPMFIGTHIHGGGSVYCRMKNINSNEILPFGYHHAVIEFTGSGVDKIYIDGVLKVSASSDLNTTTNPFYLGKAEGVTPTMSKTNLPSFKIHKGAQYAKFNIDKAWANASKIIAKLEA